MPLINPGVAFDIDVANGLRSTQSAGDVAPSGDTITMENADPITMENGDTITTE